MVKRWIVASAMMLYCLPALSLAGSPLTVGYGDSYEPFAWVEGGKVQGIQVDFVQAVLVDRMKLDVEHIGCPWKRCQRYVREGEIDAFFTVPTEERTEYTLKSLFPFYVTRFVMHTSRDNPLLDQLRKITSIEELEQVKGARHVHMLGSGWHENKLANMENVHSVKDANIIPEMLARDRADVYIEQSEMFRYQAVKLGIGSELISFEHFPIDALGWHLFIGKRSEHFDLMNRIDLVLAEMAATGELSELKKRIFAKYGIESTI